MAVTVVAVIYSKAQAKRREVIVPDNDDSELFACLNNIPDGVGVYLMPFSMYSTVGANGMEVPSPADVDGALALYLGVPAQDDRCAVIDLDGNVHHVIHADPLVDFHPDGFLIQDEEAGVGTVYDFEAQAPE